MSGRGGRALSSEDRILWHRVTRSVRPLDPAKLADIVEEPAPDTPRPPRPAKLEPAEPPAGRARETAAPTWMDTRTHGKIAKGRLTIDARIDLHGMTQPQAHGLLLDFLHQAHGSGLRHVLVITGKGRGGDGILRRVVPAWLSTAPFRGLVSAHAQAARQHGGEGALYIRLRRSAREG